MKTFFSIFALVAVALFVSSCTMSPETILPRRDGKWTFANVTKTTIGTVSNTSNTNGTGSFTKDGKATIQASGASSATNLDWSYNSSEKVITLTTTGQVINSTYKYAVSESKWSSETWTRRDTTLGVITEDVYTWKKAK